MVALRDGGCGGVTFVRAGAGVGRLGALRAGAADPRRPCRGMFKNTEAFNELCSAGCC